MVDKVVNDKAYKPSLVSKVVEFKVVAMLDSVPGAWHNPEDLMNWFASNPYVQSVELVEEAIEDPVVSDSAYQECAE